MPNLRKQFSIGTIDSFMIIRYSFGMYFEYNELKNGINVEKHGIDFITAQKIWQDVMMIEITLNFSDESRTMCIGKINKKHWTAIITYREEYIRIISVRRSRKKEILHYENC